MMSTRLGGRDKKSGGVAVSMMMMMVTAGLLLLLFLVAATTTTRTPYSTSSPFAHLTGFVKCWSLWIGGGGGGCSWTAMRLETAAANPQTGDSNSQQNDLVVNSNGTGTTAGNDQMLPNRGLAQQLLQEERPGYKRPAWYQSDTYLRRAKERTAGEWKQLTQTYGSWTLKDTKTRPDIDYSKYKYRDIPYVSFPAGSWQTDKEYLPKFLSEAIALCDRALKAILHEYGKTNDTIPLEEREKMFSLPIYDIKNGKFPMRSRDAWGIGGWACNTTLQELKRRLLHAIITEDSFVFVMGGHSSAAGHGNSFTQSYTMQLQRALEPLFARLGVFMYARNEGMGGLGTIHNGLGIGSVYGDNIDMLDWNSGMTESDPGAKDLFARQGMISGQKVPLLWGNPDSYLYERMFQGLVGAVDTHMWGTAFVGIEKTINADQAQTLPYAMRFLDCTPEAQETCRHFGYNAVCWVGREDFTPPTKQDPITSGRAKWHPGNIYHRLFSRIISYNLIKQLREGLQEWYDAEEYVLPDRKWHVTELYDSIRSKLQEAVETPCFALNLSKIVCQVPMHARSEMTPRARPAYTSIRSIMKGDYVPEPPPNCYDPPDVYNPALDVPSGQVDVLAILENGIDFVPLKARKKILLQSPPQIRRTHESDSLPSHGNRRALASGITPGKGWAAMVPAGADNCDGTYESFCARGCGSKCLLYAHNDERGYLLGDGLSGWLVLNLQDLKHGLIMILMWERESNPRTAGWKCVNNATDCPEYSDATLAASIDGGAKCQDFKFEFAIDGNIQSWSYDELQTKRKTVARVVDLFVLLDNRDFTSKSMDVELAIRMVGCGRRASLGISHIYWA